MNQTVFHILIKLANKKNPERNHFAKHMMIQYKISISHPSILDPASSFLPFGWTQEPIRGAWKVARPPPTPAWEAAPDRTEEMAAKALSLSPQPGFRVNSRSISSRRKLTNSSPMDKNWAPSDNHRISVRIQGRKYNPSIKQQDKRNHKKSLHPDSYMTER